MKLFSAFQVFFCDFPKLDGIWFSGGWFRQYCWHADSTGRCMMADVTNEQTSDQATATGAKPKVDAATKTKPSLADLDSVRMYLSHIGSVDLRREEEVEIAMEIESARNAVIDAALSTQHGINYIVELQRPFGEDPLFVSASTGVRINSRTRKRARLG